MSVGKKHNNHRFISSIMHPCLRCEPYIVMRAMKPLYRSSSTHLFRATSSAVYGDTEPLHAVALYSQTHLSPSRAFYAEVYNDPWYRMPLWSMSWEHRQLINGVYRSVIFISLIWMQAKLHVRMRDKVHICPQEGNVTHSFFGLGKSAKLIHFRQ